MAGVRWDSFVFVAPPSRSQRKTGVQPVYLADPRKALLFLSRGDAEITELFPSRSPRLRVSRLSCKRIAICQANR